MSKCDISITFNRPDRTYTGGDTVSGAVRISVNEDIRCNGIVLTHYWRTHGRGNTDRGPKNEIRLSEMVPLQAGEQLELPFEFQVGLWPVTYHGHYIHVDHYVHVGVDVPWAFDPKHEEDFILIGGQRPEEFAAGRGELVPMPRAATSATGFAKIFFFGLLTIFGLVLGTMFLFLMPVFLVIGAGYWLWQKAIKARVGDVQLQTPNVVVGPGETWPLVLSFTPRKTFRINAITVRITAQEAATSGSGTNSTTYRHTVHDETHELASGDLLLAGEEFFHEGVVPLPDLPAYSLKESDNKITWWAEVRIDMPRFPDWKKKTELQMVPIEFLDDPRLSDKVEETVFSKSSASPSMLEPNHKDANTGHRDEALSESNAAGAARDGLTTLVALVDEIRGAGRFGNERSEIVSAAEGHTYAVTIVLDRVSPTFGFDGHDDRYETGKTVIGKIKDTDQEVQVFCVRASNEMLEDLARGEPWDGAVKVRSWDSLYKRLVLLEVP